MKKLLVSAILMLTVVFSGVLLAQTPLYFGFDLSANGKYVWRGMPYNTEAILGFDVWISWKGFTDLTVKLGISYSPKGSLGNFMSFNGNLNYSTILDKELADIYEDSSYFWWEIGISLFFDGD